MAKKIRSTGNARKATSIRLNTELHKRLAHVLIDRDITATDAIHEALEAWMYGGAVPNLGTDVDETLLMRLDEAAHSVDVLKQIVYELRYAASRVSQDRIDGGVREEANGDRGSTEGDRGGDPEAKAG